MNNNVRICLTIENRTRIDSKEVKLENINTIRDYLRRKARAGFTIHKVRVSFYNWGSFTTTTMYVTIAHGNHVSKTPGCQFFQTVRTRLTYNTFRTETTVHGPHYNLLMKYDTDILPGIVTVIVDQNNRKLAYCSFRSRTGLQRYISGLTNVSFQGITVNNMYEFEWNLFFGDIPKEGPLTPGFQSTFIDNGNVFHRRNTGFEVSMEIQQNPELAESIERHHKHIDHHRSRFPHPLTIYLPGVHDVVVYNRHEMLLAIEDLGLTMDSFGRIRYDNENEEYLMTALYDDVRTPITAGFQKLTLTRPGRMKYETYGMYMDGPDSAMVPPSMVPKIQAQLDRLDELDSQNPALAGFPAVVEYIDKKHIESITVRNSRDLRTLCGFLARRGFFFDGITKYHGKTYVVLEKDPTMSMKGEPWTPGFQGWNGEWFTFHGSRVGDRTHVTPLEKKYWKLDRTKNPPVWVAFDDFDDWVDDYVRNAESVELSVREWRRCPVFQVARRD